MCFSAVCISCWFARSTSFLVVPSAVTEPQKTAATSHASPDGTRLSDAPLFKANFDDPPHAYGYGSLALPPRHHSSKNVLAPLAADAGASSAMIDRRMPPAAAQASLPFSSAEETRADAAGSIFSPNASVNAVASSSPIATVGVPASVGDVIPASLAGPPPAMAPSGQQQLTAAPTMSTSMREEKQLNTDGEGTASASSPSAEPMAATGLADEAGERKPSVIDGPGSDRGNAIPRTASSSQQATVSVSLAVSEDLAYSHRGATLQSCAITGSVLVATLGTPARLRVTDKHGHIAKVNANAAVAKETAGDATTREYLCKTGEGQAERAKFSPALMYRCSPVVKELPVRVTCRLRTVGTAVLVWVQIIANPKASRPLEGVSVLVHLPFSPRQDQVRPEPVPRRALRRDTLLQPLGTLFRYTVSYAPTRILCCTQRYLQHAVLVMACYR